MGKRIIQQLLARLIFSFFWIAIIILVLAFSRLPFFNLPQKSISIFTWPLLIDRSIIEHFENETGIKVYISYYENNEELFSKLKATRGEGYDLVIPSDYVVPMLIQEGLIKKIDRSKIEAFEQIDPKLLGHYFDPLNNYSVPYFWAIYGLGIDTRYFKNRSIQPSWSLLFDRQIGPPAVGMIDGPREAVLIAAQYLFGSIDYLDNPIRIEKIKRLLLQQKPRVQAYTESGVEYLLLSDAVPVVVTSAAEIARIKCFASYVDFVLPQEGGFALIDSFVLSASTIKDDLVYQFINFLYRPKTISYHRDIFGMCPPLKNMQKGDNKDVFCPTEQEFMKMNFFRAVMPEQMFNDIWLTLMAM